MILFDRVSHVHNLSTPALNHSEFFTKFFKSRFSNGSCVHSKSVNHVNFSWNFVMKIQFPASIFVSGIRHLIIEPLKINDYGKFTLPYCSHTDYRLACWIYRLRRRRNHSHFTRNCNHSSAVKCYTRKKVYLKHLLMVEMI